MSDIAKLEATLGDVSSRIDAFTKSHAAEVKAATEGVAKVQADLDAQRKTLQEISELAKRGIPASQRDAAAAFGEAIKRSYRPAGQRAASGSTDATGGYVVNDDLRTNLLTAQNQYGVVRALLGASIVPMASDVTKIAVDTFEDTAGNVPVPASKAESAQITESTDAQLSQITLTATKYATMNYVPAELLADAFIPWVGAYLQPKLLRQKAKKEDSIVLGGLLASADLRTYTLDDSAFTSVSGDDLILAQDEVCDDALMDGRYILHRSMLSHIRTLKGTDGQYLFSPLTAGEAATIAGYPYSRANVMPARSASAADTAFALFGDIRLGCAVGERGEMRLDSSEDFRFDYDQVAVRMIWRFAFNTNANIGRALVRIKSKA